jgi:hypothetical protein
MKRDILAAARAIAPRKDVHAIAADRHQGIFGGVAGETKRVILAHARKI